ncbi:hypothetical protein FG386_003573 [Cryptosporidium ryanae]|uniref:uncharacterized protein n=1 Tax=Cryptosporidium ryanae TaxID=515981 RepID=UPI00351A2DC9|nr:hypothetical protein FG386_003573 [Cryptosporidium ryanae]
MSRKRKTDPSKDNADTGDDFNIEEWKRVFFSDSNGVLKDNDSFEDRNDVSHEEELELLEMMDPDAFDRIPMIYEAKSPEFIEENWKETRHYLTQDYIKKSKLANRKLKNRTFT